MLACYKTIMLYVYKYVIKTSPLLISIINTNQKFI